MKPITLTPEDITQAKLAFDLYLSQLKTPGETIDFKFKYDKKSTVPAKYQRATIILNTRSYLQMQALVSSSNKELAWHGVVTKRKDCTYVVSDILCYPQRVTAATVESDDDLYPQWLMQLEDDTINNMRMQGHSHVNFTTSPSSTDLQNWDKMLDGIKNGFYIFNIVNKSNDCYWIIYDKDIGVVYEKSDIDVKIYLGNNTFLDVWAATQIKDNIKERTCSYQSPTLTTPNTNKQTQLTFDNIYNPVGMTEGGFDVYQDKGGYYCLDDGGKKLYLTKKEMRTLVTLYNDLR